MKTVIEMAREAGFVLIKSEWAYVDMLERFAELVRADALVNPCCGNFDKCQQICMPRAAAKEREACAMVAEEHMREREGASFGIGAAIRARGNT